MKYLFHTDSFFRSCRTYTRDILERVSEGTRSAGGERLTGGIQGDDVVALGSYNSNKGLGYQIRNREIHTGATLVTPSPTDSTCIKLGGLQLMVRSNSRCLRPRDQVSQGTDPKINESIAAGADPKSRFIYLGILATASVLVGVAYT